MPPKAKNVPQIRVVGHSTFRAGLSRARHIVARRASLIVRAEGNEVKKRALFYCPIKTGALRGTARTQGPKQAQMNVGIYQVAVRFGGARAPYAVQVHENLRQRHAKPTQAKFLWQALIDRRAAMLLKASRGLKGALR